MTEKKYRLLSVFIFISLIGLPGFFSGCASRNVAHILPPAWFAALEEKQENGAYYFPVSSEADRREEAVDRAAGTVMEKLLEFYGAKDLYAVEQDRALLLESLRRLILTGEAEDGDPVKLERSEWLSKDGYEAFFGYFCIPPDGADLLEQILAEEYFGSDENLVEILKTAEDHKENGRLYQAVESLLQAAVYVLDTGNPLTVRMADRYVEQALSIMERIKIEIAAYPSRVDANSKVDKPFSLRCTEGIIGIRGIEFLVQYKGKKRDASIGTFEVRMVSDLDGYVSFFHPFLPFAGESEVVMSPGSRTLRTSLRELEPVLETAAALKDYLDDETVVLPFTVESVARMVPTGVVILHTDMTGATLDSRETSNGLTEVLEADGFDLELMNLSPREITASNEASFLRDLKAAYKGRYKRVVFGVVGINDFDIRNDVYKVETSGVLKVVDVNTGEILLIVEQVKSVESRDNAQAVSAAFRELGKAFAEVLKDQLY